MNFAKPTIPPPYVILYDPICTLCACSDPKALFGVFHGDVRDCPGNIEKFAMTELWGEWRGGEELCFSSSLSFDSRHRFIESDSATEICMPRHLAR